MFHKILFSHNLFWQWQLFDSRNACILHHNIYSIEQYIDSVFKGVDQPLCYCFSIWTLELFERGTNLFEKVTFDKDHPFLYVDKHNSHIGDQKNYS